MTYLSHPTVDGIYRIKVLDEPLFVEGHFDYGRSGTDSELRLSKLNTSKKEQEWRISAVPGRPGWYTINSNYDQANLSYSQRSITKMFPKRGYPLPIKNTVTYWFIKESTVDGKTFCKIGYGDFHNTDVFACWFWYGRSVVNFDEDKPQISGQEKYQCYVLELLSDSDSDASLLPSALDLLILQDATGSQQPYINQARDEIISITNSLASSHKFAKGDLRARVIAFRDHPPQEPAFVTRTCPLTSNIPTVQSYLRSLVASGGGDGPEAQCEALYGALTADWRSDATKIAILITDAPPHGAGEYGDLLPECPDQNDPIVLARRMAQLGITLIVVACQPTMGKYKQAFYFYTSLVKFSGGMIIPLGDVDGLNRLITNAVAETVDIEAHVTQRRKDVRAMTGSFATVSKKLHTELTSTGVHINTVAVDKIFEETAEAKKMMKIWSNAETMAEGRSKITKSSRPLILFEAGSQSLDLKRQPIALAQTENIVRKCLNRASWENLSGLI